MRAYAYSPDQSRRLFENALDFQPLDDSSWEIRGDARGSTYYFDEPPSERGVPGAGTVHHVAWASQTEDRLELCAEMLVARRQRQALAERLGRLVGVKPGPIEAISNSTPLGSRK